MKDCIEFEDKICDTKVKIFRNRCRCLSCGQYILEVEDEDGKRSHEIYTFMNGENYVDDLAYAFGLLVEDKLKENEK